MMLVCNTSMSHGFNSVSMMISYLTQLKISIIVIHSIILYMHDCTCIIWAVHLALGSNSGGYTVTGRWGRGHFQAHVLDSEKSLLCNAFHLARWVVTSYLDLSKKLRQNWGMGRRSTSIHVCMYMYIVDLPITFKTVMVTGHYILQLRQ